MRLDDLTRSTIELSNGTTFEVVSNIGEQIEAAFLNWSVRAQSERDEEWFQELSAECFCKYICSKGDFATTWENFQKEYANAEEEE